MGKTAFFVCCLMLAATAAMAADIVTVPTANQLRAGEVDMAYYRINLDLGPEAPSKLNFNTLYVGLTDWLEIDAHRTKPGGGPSSTIWNATILVLKEDQKNPNVVIGGRNLEGQGCKASWFVSAAKTVLAPVGGPPSLKSPVVRLHLSVGTDDWTMFGEKRHQGIFGGVQSLLDPRLGLVALYDGQDMIYAITYTHTPKWPTLKVGKLGKHEWVGISYTFTPK
jgi:hypothetical protein